MPLYDNQRRRPNETGERSFCPCCSGEMIAKCGSIMMHHWAHAAGSDCDSFSEGLTPWHIEWQSCCPDFAVEVPLQYGNDIHRADAITSDGRVIEFQHSPISTDEVKEREWFYGNMIWVFDVTSSIENFTLKQHEGSVRYVWKRMKQTLQACRRPVILDLGDRVIFCRLPISSYGRGRIFSKDNCMSLITKMCEYKDSAHVSMDDLWWISRCRFYAKNAAKHRIQKEMNFERVESEFARLSEWPEKRKRVLSYQIDGHEKNIRELRSQVEELLSQIERSETKREKCVFEFDLLDSYDPSCDSGLANLCSIHRDSEWLQLQAESEAKGIPYRESTQISHNVQTSEVMDLFA